MTSQSHRYVIISPEKSENKMCKRFHWYVIVQCQQEGRRRHLEIFNMWAHFEISNEDCGESNASYVLKLKIETHFDVT